MPRRRPVDACRRAACLLLSGALLLPLAAAEESLSARPRAERVNLRARPELNAEVVAQVGPEELLQVLAAQEEWVQVIPPDRVDLWIHRDFVKDGRTVADKVNLRAGAGINFSVVGQVERGRAIDARGQFGEWIKVAPGAGSLWVSREWVELILPARPVVPLLAPAAPVMALPEPAAPMPAAQGAPPAAPAAALPTVKLGVEPSEGAAPPADLKLVPLEGQGRLVQREGELKPALFTFGQPTRFRLTRREGNMVSTICYVRGNPKQLQSLLNERLILRGREYWVQGVRQPVLVLERIERPSP